MRLQNRQFFIMVLVIACLWTMISAVAFAQDPEQGKLVWEEQSSCSRCHVEGGQDLWGPPLEGNDHTAEEWIEQVRNPRRNMPSFHEGQISDEQIIDLHAYLITLEKPESTTRGDAGLTDDAHPGQVVVVEKLCVACHSPTGPVRGFMARGDRPTVEGVLEQVRHPRDVMPAYSETQISEDEVTLIVDFLITQLEAEEEEAEEAEQEEVEEEEMEEKEVEEVPMDVPEMDPDIVLGVVGLFIFLLGLFV